MKNNTVVTVALYGSIWGLLEATLGGVLHLARVPYTGTIMASIGFALLFAALRAGLRPGQLVGVSLLAASFKFLDPLIFPVAWNDITVINPAFAIASQGLAMVVIFRDRAVPRSSLALAPRFLGAAAMGMALFNVFSVVVMGHSTNHIAYPANALLLQLPLMAIGATLLSKAILLFEDRVPISLAPRWRAAATAACALMTMAMRFILR